LGQNDLELCGSLSVDRGVVGLFQTDVRDMHHIMSGLAQVTSNPP
jgi:hypothetical protein